MENKLIDDCMKLGFGMMRLPRVEGTNDIDLARVCPAGTHMKEISIGRVITTD